MTTKLPGVAGGVLWGAGVPSGYLVLDTAAWCAWLEVTSTGFAYPVVDPADGFLVDYLIVRPELRQGARSWWAYRRQGTRTQRRYVGRSDQVTQARLEEVARAFLQAAALPEDGGTAVPAAG